MRPAIDLSGDVRVAVTTRADGDQRARSSLQYSHRSCGVADVDPELFQRTITGVRWTFSRQVHGSDVRHVDECVGPMAFAADGLVTTRAHLPLAMLGADCSLVGLASDEGIIGVTHAGWRGLLTGVLGSTVRAMRELGAQEITAIIGPTIGPECYEFSATDLIALVERFGERVHVRRNDHTDALDLRRCVAVALAEVSVRRIIDLAGCTACDSRFYSWRARREEGRHALVIWRAAEDHG